MKSNIQMDELETDGVEEKGVGVGRQSRCNSVFFTVYAVCGCACVSECLCVCVN